MDLLQLSLVTGTIDRRDSFYRLLDSVVRCTDVPWEMVVADASSECYAANCHPQARVFEERPRLGYVRAYNRCFAECLGEWVLFLNDDAEVTPGYAGSAIRFMQRHTGIGLGALHYCDGPGSEFRVNSAWGTIYANFGIMRRSVGAAVGWFDPDLEMYGSDNSLALRMLMKGYGVADIPEARIIHHSVQDDTRKANQKTRAKDNQTLTRKYMPYRSKWTQTFNNLKVKTGTIPWSHGVRPR